MHVHESSKEFQISLDESFPSSNRLKTFKTLPEFAHDSSGFIAPPRYHCFIFSLSQVRRRLNYDVSAIGRVRGCHTSPRPETIRSRGSKDLETKGNAKKNLKRGEEKFETEQKFKGEPPRGEPPLGRGEETEESKGREGGKEWSGSGGRTFPECHRGGGDLNCAGNKMEMRVVEWETGGGMK